MFIKKLEINGFKSFASKTMLDFSYGGKSGGNHGITSIVGPNGSGKSNIADALRWVMGEQSMKNLRGKKSEDIIFAGSGKKARLGSAGVTMTLDNLDKRIPLDFDEVSIARKIFRSGESEFLVNGSRVRLQDIVDILAKAGVGKQSYAIINQGMADSVLNATPVERRSMIEDAAGVKQYQIKKERSIRKLDSTRQNLDKVKGLIEEIKPHLRLLKRQAEKAAQSEVIARELKEKQIGLYSWLWMNFRKEKEQLTEEKDGLGREMMNIQREVDKLSDEISHESKEERSNQKMLELEKKQRESRNKLGQLERDLIITEGRIEIEKEKQKNLEMIQEIKTKSLPVDMSYVKDRIEDIRNDQKRLIARIAEAESRDDIQDLKEFAQAIQQKLYELRSEIEKGKKEETQEDKEEKKEAAIEKEKVDSQAIVELKEKTLKLREEINALELEISDIGKSIYEEQSAERQMRQKFFEIERMLRKKQDELGRFKDKFNDSKIALARVEVREEDLRNDVRESLRMEVERLPEIDGEIDREALDREISRLKIKMEQVGGIDPAIVDEYQDTQKRYDFLTGESADLENAITSLKEVIKEMEQKINKEFASTFEEINKEFTKYFRVIFGGGNAHLSKLKIKSSKLKIAETEEENGVSVEDNGETQEENKDEIGIDISACPPGKKISHLSMLSGGERSLTSLALLFAIISHNPPPFAVLDEVEAALDEANSKRFGRIIQDLSERTQFVIITHNRETMRQASLLYGVTMGEDGISKLLSVRLDQVGAGGKIMK